MTRANWTSATAWPDRPPPFHPWKLFCKAYPAKSLSLPLYPTIFSLYPSGLSHSLSDGEVRAVLAERDDRLLGFASFRRTEDFAHYQPQRADAPRAYICEAVVHPAAAGQGLGSALLEAVLAQLADEGIEDVYIDRHEENLASAGMMRKAGFVELETYADPARRPNGSGRSTVCHRNLSLQRRAVR